MPPLLSHIEPGNGIECKARLLYNWQFCLPADGYNLLNEPNTGSRIFELLMKTERTNIYRNYKILHQL